MDLKYPALNSHTKASLHQENFGHQLSAITNALVTKITFITKPTTVIRSGEECWTTKGFANPCLINFDGFFTIMVTTIMVSLGYIITSRFITFDITNVCQLEQNLGDWILVNFSAAASSYLILTFTSKNNKGPIFIYFNYTQFTNLTPAVRKVAVNVIIITNYTTNMVPIITGRANFNK